MAKAPPGPGAGAAAACLVAGARGTAWFRLSAGPDAGSELSSRGSDAGPACCAAAAVVRGGETIGPAAGLTAGAESVCGRTEDQIVGRPTSAAAPSRPSVTTPASTAIQ